MITRDYILRMIEQAALVLRRILRLKEMKQWEEALKEAHLAGTTVFGPDFVTLRLLSGENMVKYFHSSDGFDHERAILMGKILAEEGDILAGQLFIDQAQVKRFLAANLLAESWLESRSCRTNELQTQINRLLKNMPPEWILPELEKKLKKVFETPEWES